MRLQTEFIRVINMSMPNPMVGIHLDLKFQIPSKEYLLDWVQLLPSMGVNTLLIEYEDKFPYQNYPFVRSSEAFTHDELTLFLSTARKVGLTVIPLVQSLSHLEFALGHEELAHLREVPETHTLMDVSNPQGIAFLKEMYDEVLAYHEEDAMFHLGGDEVQHLGLNERSAAMLKEHGLLTVWVNHMTQLVDHLKDAGKRAIVWDDIFWKVTPEEIMNCKLSRDVLCHSWQYVANCTPGNLASLTKRVSSYIDAGFTVIGGPCLNWGVGTPRHDHCLENTRAWAIVIDKLKLAGMINTSWACFHVLPHATTVQIAGMSEMMKHPDEALSTQWQEAYMGRHFGCDATGFVKAMQNVATFWELEVKRERPLTCILYGNMDMIIGYGSHELRMTRGAYPIDFEEVDFDDVLRQKLAYFKAADQDDSVSLKLKSYRQELVIAESILTPIAASAKTNVAEAKYLAFTARIKMAYVDLLLVLLKNEVPSAKALGLWKQLGDEFEVIMSPLMNAYSIRGMKRMWWKPMASLLPSATNDAAMANGVSA